MSKKSKKTDAEPVKDAFGKKPPRGRPIKNHEWVEVEPEIWHMLPKKIQDKVEPDCVGAD